LSVPPLNGLTYVELDIPTFNSPDTTATLRLAVDTDYLPKGTDAIPNIKSIGISPAAISLGKDLGIRATITVTCRDHRHVFNGEDYNSGTFWGKFRARYGLRLRGYPLRVIQGVDIQGAPNNMENRHYIIESTDGPSPDGEYKIVAKDVLKLADNTRAQAPLISNGFLIADIVAGPGVVATLSPAGIGNLEYPASGVVAIGGKEIALFTRSGDAMTLTTRGQFNTIDVAHNAQDRVQVCLNYAGVNPANILNDLLVNYAGIDPSFINLSEWLSEISSYLNVAYSALIAEPTGVNQLCSELIEQMAGAMWWDDIAQKIRLQILRAVPSNAFTYDPSNVMANSFDVQEQPDQRISSVQVYFGKINPLVKDDQLDNYRCTSQISDTTAEAQYGSAVIKQIFSRWIASGGRATAEILANKLLGRYRDPPRRFSFSVMRYSGGIDPVLGASYHLGAYPLQDVTGASVAVPVQVTSIAADVSTIKATAEEMLWTPYGDDIDPTNKTITFDFDEKDINARSRHDALYPAPTSGDTVTVIVNSGVRIGSSSTASPALNMGIWPGGVTLILILRGRIEGKGGAGGSNSSVSSAGVAGSVGGPALYSRTNFQLQYQGSAAVWGGGGGGGGGGWSVSSMGAGGGGGAGYDPGNGGTGSNNGSPGTDTAGGAGGPAAAGIAPGGQGGGPGLVGFPGANSAGAGGAAGLPGAAIDGISFATVTGGADVRGAQIN